jgi:hypothetical protein
MTYIKVLDNHECIESSHSDEAYGDWSEEYAHKIEGIVISHEQNGYFDLTVDYPVNSALPHFLVTAVHSEGDSFGRADGKIEHLWLFESKADAEACAKQVDAGDGERFNFIQENGKSVLIDGSAWRGYFECLDRVEVTEINKIEVSQ